jgi:hypothetical protein
MFIILEDGPTLIAPIFNTINLLTGATTTVRRLSYGRGFYL